jgi:hypothetical protein
VPAGVGDAGVQRCGMSVAGTRVPVPGNEAPVSCVGACISPTRMPSAETVARVRRTGARVSAYSSGSDWDWRAGPAGWCVLSAPRNADGGYSRAGFPGMAHGSQALAFQCGRWVCRCPALVRQCGALADGSPTLTCGCGTLEHPLAALAHACGLWVLPSPTLASACGRRSILSCPLVIQKNLTCVSSGDLAVGFHALNPDAVSGPRSGPKGRRRQSEVLGELR